MSHVVGRAWVVTDMEGFPDENREFGELFFRDETHMTYQDGLNRLRHTIDWDDTGFTVDPIMSSTLVDDSGYTGPRSYLSGLASSDYRVDVFVNEDSSIELRTGDRTVSAVPYRD